MTPFYAKAHKKFRNIVFKLFRVTVTGEENFPENGGCLVCANHTSWMDTVVLGASMKRQPRYMAKKELFKLPIIGKLITKLGAYPVNRGSIDLVSMKTTLKLLEDGECVTMFPQGHRYPKVNPRSTPVKNGVGMFAMRSKCTVVPVYIRTKHNRTVIFGGCEVIFGKSMEYGEYHGDGEKTPENYSRVSHEVFARICDIGGVPEVGSEKI